MKYYKLVYDYENDDNYINCSIGNIGNMNEYITSNGTMINDWGNVVFEYNAEEGSVLSDYVANVYRWLIVSNKFCSLTKKVLLNEVQYLPIKIEDVVSKTENSTYQVANILNVVDALDLKNSKYDVFELDGEKILTVEKYALKESEIKGHHIFRLKDDTIPIFVSEKIKNIIELDEMLGFAFLEVNVN
jgi:hypothetical protein